MFRIPPINDQEILNIPGIYRVRIYITTAHLIPYDESNIEHDTIDIYRKMHLNATYDLKKIYYCYILDVRKIINNYKSIIINNQEYYLQPNDYQKIQKIWKQVNCQTIRSVKYMSQFEYYKSLSINFKNFFLKYESDDEFKKIFDDYVKIINNNY